MELSEQLKQAIQNSDKPIIQFAVDYEISPATIYGILKGKQPKYFHVKKAIKQIINDHGQSGNLET